MFFYFFISLASLYMSIDLHLPTSHLSVCQSFIQEEARFLPPRYVYSACRLKGNIRNPKKEMLRKHITTLLCIIPPMLIGWSLHHTHRKLGEQTLQTVFMTRAGQRQETYNAWAQRPPVPFSLNIFLLWVYPRWLNMLQQQHHFVLLYKMLLIVYQPIGIRPTVFFFNLFSSINVQ